MIKIGVETTIATHKDPVRMVYRVMNRKRRKYEIGFWQLMMTQVLCRAA